MLKKGVKQIDGDLWSMIPSYALMSQIIDIRGPRDLLCTEMKALLRDTEGTADILTYTLWVTIYTCLLGH